jgi:hypothetical protein
MKTGSSAAIAAPAMTSPIPIVRVVGMSGIPPMWQPRGGVIGDATSADIYPSMTSYESTVVLVI